MAATFQWDESNGAGETVTQSIGNANWKNQDSSTDNYASFPIVAGNNSFEKWIAGRLSGAYNQVLNGLFAHTSGALGTGLTLKGPPAMTVDGDKLTYATPATTTNASLTTNMTSVISIGSGVAVWFGLTSPTGTKTASHSNGGSDTIFTNYLTTQLQTTGAASPGDTASVTLTLQYDEN